jgi:hypothetical protein
MIMLTSLTHSANALLPIAVTSCPWSRSPDCCIRRMPRADRSGADRDNDACQLNTSVECSISNHSDTFAYSHVFQSAAFGECLFPNRSNTIGNCDVGQTAAVIECARTDRSDTVWDYYVCQTAAVEECVITNRSDTVGDYNACQAVTCSECSISNKFTE